MNIFVVDLDPVIAASQLCDKHVVKMVLETAQMLCTVRNLSNLDSHYKTAHPSHPCTIWARESSDNYEWLILHGLALAAEYTRRYGRTHKSQQVIEDCLESSHQLTFPSIGLTPFAVCMGDEYKVTDDVVASYRNYYINAKGYMAKWDKREGSRPDWFIL